MSVFASDRNLLVGVLGLQMGMITEGALLLALQSWVFRKSVALEEILLEQNALVQGLEVKPRAVRLDHYLCLEDSEEVSPPRTDLDLRRHPTGTPC